LPYPRGRGEKISNEYDNVTAVFGASGGASIYRVKMLEQIGLFDEDFFAYYEDVDLSFRAQLAGWKVAYVPGAVVYHQIGATSSRVPDFTTYQTLKNLPMLMWKNVPWRLMPKVWWRFELAYTLIVIRALSRGQFGAVFKGLVMWIVLSPKKFYQRHQIQKRRKVTIEYLNSMITQDLPPNAHSLRKLRAQWWKLRGKHA
jgi:GT2 family glycosyltransferase